MVSANEKCQVLEVTLAMELAIKSSLHDQLSAAKEEIASLQRANDDARREFSVALDKLRALGQQAEERLRGAEERSLLELDRERQLGRKLQQELESVRDTAKQAADRYHAEIKALQEQIGTLRQQVGVREGNLQAITLDKNQLSAELERVRQTATDANARASALRVDADQWRERAENFEKAVAERQPPPKQKTSRKKSSGDPGS